MLAVLVAPAEVDAAPQVLVAAGDVLPGAGTVSDVTDVAIDDAGHWAASVALDGTTDRHALVVDGVVLVPPATPLPGLPGHELRGAGSLAVVDGVPIWVAMDATQDPADGFGAYVGTTPIAVVGQTLAGPGIPVGAVVETVHQMRAVGTGHYLVGLTITTGGGPALSLLARFVAQPGGAYDVASVVKTGDAIAGRGATVVSLDRGIESLATNAHAEPLFVATLTDGETVVVRGTTEIAGAHEPAQSPPQLVQWGQLSGAPLAMNDAGVALIGGSKSGLEMLVKKQSSALIVATDNDGPPLLHPYDFTQLFTGHDPLHPTPRRCTSRRGRT